MRTLAIGDIHGCATALGALLDAVAPQPSDTLIFLGDYIDRGPDSRGVIEQILAVSQRCQVIGLLGNHELMLMAAMSSRLEESFWRACGGEQTLISYGRRLSKIPPSHLAFIHSCLAFFETDTHFFVHANYDAEAPLDEQPEEALFWRHLSEHAPPPHQSGKIAIAGHTPQIDGAPLNAGHLVCIDTFCYGGGWLTALDVASGIYWQANQQGQARQGAVE